MQKTLLLLLFSLSFGATLAQPVDPPPNAKPGACYAICLLPDEYNYLIDSRFPVFTGQNAAGLALDTVRLNGPRWVREDDDKPSKKRKKKANPTYRLSEANETLVVVRDTTQTTEFEWKTFWKQGEVVKKGGFTEWKEVLCPDKITPELIQKLATKLHALGYEVEAETTEMTKDLKKELARFQKEYALPVGGLNTDTLRMLGL